MKSASRIPTFTGASSITGESQAFFPHFKNAIKISANLVACTSGKSPVSDSTRERVSLWHTGQA